MDTERTSNAANEALAGRRPGTLGRALALCVAGACLLGAAGCVRTAESTQPAAPETSRAVESMPFENRGAQLPASFPIEVPVPEGRVQSAVEQDEGGSGAWAYDLTSEASVAALADWYARAYASANWSLAEQSGDSAALKLVFVKGDAQSVIQLTQTDSGTRVQATVGVGVPVADTL